MAGFIFQQSRRRWRGAVMLAGGLLMASGPGAAETRPVPVVDVTPPLCNRFPHNNQLACTNVVQVAVGIPEDTSRPGLVRCVLYSAEEQVLGTGEAILRAPAGKLWVVLHSRGRFGSEMMHARTTCTIQPTHTLPAAKPGSR